MNSRVRQVASDIRVQWRNISLAQLQEIPASHPTNIAVELEDLADMLPALIDGAIIFLCVAADQSALPRQIQLYIKLIRNTFNTNVSCDKA